MLWLLWFRCVEVMVALECGVLVDWVCCGYGGLGMLRYGGLKMLRLCWIEGVGDMVNWMS